MRPRTRLMALAAAVALAAAGLLPATASATPVCSDGDTTLCLGRVFPEPEQSATALTYAETVAGLEALAEEFPGWLTVSTIGQSHDGYDLVMFEITDPDSDIPLADREVVFVAQSIHGNEPGGREGGVRYVEDLLRDVDPERKALLDRVRLVQMLMNPDGWTSGDHDHLPDPADIDSVGTWNRGNGNTGSFPAASDFGGVDLNRQFPWRGWIPSNREPLSEPESRALVDEIERRLDAGEDLVASTDIHGEVTDAAAWIMLSSGQFDLDGIVTQVGHGEAVDAAVDAALDDDALVTLSQEAGQAVDAGILTASSEFGSPGVGGSGSGFLGDWLAQPEGGGTNSISTIELFALDPSGPGFNSGTYRREIMQIYRATVAAILGALLDQAVIDYEPRVVVDAPVGYVLDPLTVTDPILREPRSPMDFFSDLAPFVSPGLRALDPGSIAEPGALDGLGSVVVTSDLVAEDGAAVAALRSFADAGGNLLLTDSGARLLPSLADQIEPADVREVHNDIGSVAFSDFSHHLLDGVRENAFMLVEGATLGYDTTRGQTPVWTVDRGAWEGSGGTTLGSTSGATSVGEMGFGDGTIRLIGTLLPPPVTDNKILYGLNSYGPLDTGYKIFVNSLDAELEVTPVGQPAGTHGTPSGEVVAADAESTGPAPVPVTGGGGALLALSGLLAAMALAPGIGRSRMGSRAGS